MQRLCIESACSYPGRAVQPAARVDYGSRIEARLKSLDQPSNSNVAVIAMGGGRGPRRKTWSTERSPTAIQAAHSVATLAM
jgi:hypothetical protein